ncbi:hypothetical protein G6F49_012498 [Rhizopus delemar]|uniref:Uncharacterized protein n=2 Tax=Rhizopus TaxID=4842 RepID=A0A9P6XXK7_RHIOR|nr:hypothetical protein G6F51_012103 [Rhizopus arrhizus]KAG1538820.1 hypothetical protein G6F49_012498 [Rhizopus delemar]
MDQAQAMVFLANEWLKVKPETINGMLPDLPKNFDNKVTDVSQLNLEADESEMIVCYTTSTTNNEETAEGNIDETEENDNTEQDEQCVDIVECKNRLREAYETIIMYEVPLDDLDRKLHCRIRMRLADSCAELNVKRANRSSILFYKKIPLNQTPLNRAATVQYCTRAFERFKVLPVVLVFEVKMFTSKEFEKKFVPKVNAPYLLETSCEFWAQEANFISLKSIENHIKMDMNQLVALTYFTICQSPSLGSLEYAGDLTVRFLYSICKANMKKKGDSKIIEIIDQSTEQIKKAIELDEEDPILTAEKCKGFAEQLLETIQVQKRKLVEVYELDIEASQKQQKKYTTGDFKFIKSNSEPGKPKNWKKIFNEGKAKGLFASYTSSNALKSSYHHTKKREKIKE